MAFRLPRLNLSKKNREKFDRWKRKFLGVVIYPWNLLVNSCSKVGSAFSKAWTTRHLRYLIQGIPALAALAGVIALAANVHSMDKSNLAMSYLREAATAYRNDKLDVTRSLLEKALKLEGSEKERIRFHLAQVLFKENKRDHCLAIMRSLAPETATGYPPAHLWLGQYNWQTYFGTKDKLNETENHFIKAWRGASLLDPAGDDAKEAAIRLGGFYFATKRYDQAVKYLEAATSKYPYVRLNLAGVYQILNRPDEMKRSLETLVSHCKTKIEANVNDREARLNLAIALTALERYPEAVDVMKTGIIHDPKDSTFPNQLSNTLADWDASLARKPDSSIGERFGLVQQGLFYCPIHKYHLGRLLEFSNLKGEDGEKAKKIMEELLLKQQSAPIIHFLMGNRAFQENRPDEAQYHWEQAFARDPNFAAVANNLAWILSHQKTPDHEKALEIINKTIQKMPNLPNLYGTRGEIRYRMGNYKEALADLEIGLKASPLDAGLHEALADTHKQLNNINMSEIHRRKAEELRQKAERKQGVPQEIDPATPVPNQSIPKTTGGGTPKSKGG